jgi:hypothetical protein
MPIGRNVRDPEFVAELKDLSGSTVRYQSNLLELVTSGSQKRRNTSSSLPITTSIFRLVPYCGSIGEVCLRVVRSVKNQLGRVPAPRSSRMCARGLGYGLISRTRRPE